MLRPGEADLAELSERAGGGLLAPTTQHHAGSWSYPGRTPRHHHITGYRGALAACAGEGHGSVAKNDDRVRNLAGPVALAARPRRWSVTLAERSAARPLAASTPSVGGRRSTAHGAGTGRSAADGPGRRAAGPHRSPAWRPRSTPAVKCAAGRVRNVVGALFAQCGRRLAGSRSAWGKRVKYGYGRVC